MNKREQGALGESVVVTHLESQGWRILERNWTIQGGEIDVIVENDEYIVCVEVRTVSVIDDIMAYMHDKKIGHLKRSFNTYLFKHPSKKQPRIDVIFVKDNSIRETYENVTGV